MSEINDCSVRAVMHAAGVTYERAHAALARAGRQRNDGAYWRQVLDALRLLGVAYSTPYGVPFSCTRDRVGLNTRQLAAHARHSVWLVSTSKHYTACVYGQYSDYIQHAQRARAITGAVRLDDPTAPSLTTGSESCEDSR
jgi:hypothetical protein